MRSTMRLMLAASLLLAVTGCAGSPVIVASPSACAEVIPDSWEKGVGHADDPEAAPPAPTGDAATAPYWKAMYLWSLDELKKWTGFAVAEAARVDQADGRTADAIGIMKRCEARDAKAVKAARPKVLGIF